MLSHARAALTRIRELFRRRARLAAEQSEELALHLDMETAENIRRGMGEVEARRAAILRFGGVQRFREETSDARGVVVLDNLARDTRFALRRLKRAPAFAAGVIATLGVGIGAAVGIGTIVYDVLLRDLPYDRPDQLVRVGFVTDGIGVSGDLQSPATFFHFAKSAHSFTELGAYSTNDAFAITDGDVPERVTIALMTPGVLTLLGAHALTGNLFAPGDTSWYTGRTPILISENLWRRRYGADPAIIGRHIEIDHGERTVIGVLPRSFRFPSPSVDIFYPSPVPVRLPGITVRYLNVIGRLRQGVSPSAAAAELNALIPRLTERFPAITPEMLRQARARATVESLQSATVAPVSAQLRLLGVLVAIVLLTATTNVVNLFLLRAERASHEMAIAVSLGATRVALAQRFVVEGIVLGVTAACLAVPVAALVLSTKFGFTEREIPRLGEVSFTWPTILLTFGCATVIGAAVGLVALTRTGLAGTFDRLRASRAASSPAWRRAQGGLVASQVGLALVLLVAAGLLGRSFWNLRNAQLGFDPGNRMMFQVSLPWSGYTSYAADAEFHARVLDRLATLPGVTSVGAASQLPLTGGHGPPALRQVRAGDDVGRAAVAAASNMATAGYFRTMGIPLLAGRSFRAGDLRDTPAVVVSERVVRILFGTTPAIGRRIVIDAGYPAMFTIVGVVGDVQWEHIEDGNVPMVYFPLLRDGDGIPADSEPVYRPMDVQYAIRGTELPSASTIRSIVAELDHRVPASNIRTLGSLVDDATARVRLTMLLIGVAGATALLLAVIGVYSVVAYAASARMREFGIRLALGAAPTRVGAMVLGDGLRLVGIGTFAGLVAALAATRFLRALLYEVKPTGIAEFASATALLVVVTLCATFLPARRAAHTHPAVVLRSE